MGLKGCKAAAELISAKGRSIAFEALAACRQIIYTAAFNWLVCMQDPKMSAVIHSIYTTTKDCVWLQT